MTVVGTAQRIEAAIGGMSLVGVGAGLAEMVASAGVMELVPVRARGKYIGHFIRHILAYMWLPSLWLTPFDHLFNILAQLYSQSTWRWGAWIALMVSGVNFVLAIYLLSSPSSTKLLGSHQIRHFQAD